MDTEAKVGHPIEMESLRPEGGGAVLFEGYAHGGVQTAFFVTDAQPGMGPALHRHDYDEVFVVLEGEARIWIGDEQIEAHGGQIVVAPAGVPHRFVNSGAGPLRTVNIHPRDRVTTEWL